MDKFITYLKVLVITATAVFIAFHTVLFIRSVEANPFLAWLLAAITESGLIILVMQRGNVNLYV